MSWGSVEEFSDVQVATSQRPAQLHCTGSLKQLSEFLVLSVFIFSTSGFAGERTYIDFLPVRNELAKSYAGVCTSSDCLRGVSG